MAAPGAPDMGGIAAVFTALVLGGGILVGWIRRDWGQKQDQERLRADLDGLKAELRGVKDRLEASERANRELERQLWFAEADRPRWRRPPEREDGG